ncbi:MAG: hypothetical protein JW927_04460 [Deltaproteobacteria bacterium]|nr:hypothetical protein [Deltaproteobacteria bacterium]
MLKSISRIIPENKYSKDFLWKSVKGAYTLKSDEEAKKMAAEIYPETYKAMKARQK